MTKITKKQYLIASRKLDVDGMKQIFSGGDIYVYVGEGLPTMVYGDGTVLLGYAYSMKERGCDVSREIEARGERTVAELARYWTGRWTLIADGRLYTDAVGLMGAYYISDERGWYISSSLAVLSFMLPDLIKYPVASGGLTWRITPGTVLPPVKKLLATQCLELNADRLDVVFYNWIEDLRGLTTDEKCREIAELLTVGAYNIADRFDNVNIALTAGKDSRLAFGAFVESGKPFDCFTFSHAGISKADRRIPSRLAADFGIPYRFIPEGVHSTNLAEDYTAFTCGNSDGADKIFYSTSRFAELKPGSAIIRSGLFEAGQTYGRSICGDTAESFRAGFVSYYKPDDLQAEALDSWLDYVEKNPINFIDLRDRAYIEQRCGGWISAIEQSMDMNDFVSIQIANCPRLLSVLLCASKDERESLALSFGTMDALNARLKKYPVNPKSLKDRIRAIGSKIKRILKR